MPEVRENIVQPELSYNIVGACIDAFHEIGSGHREAYYQKAVALYLKKRGIPFQEQVHCPLECLGEKIGSYFLDFLVAGTVVLELKVSGAFRRVDYQQVKGYLVHTGLPLGILARFDERGVTTTRILRPISVS